MIFFVEYNKFVFTGIIDNIILVFLKSINQNLYKPYPKASNPIQGLDQILPSSFSPSETYYKNFKNRNLYNNKNLLSD